MTEEQLKENGRLIDLIIFQCKVNDVPDLDTIFIHLATLERPQLVKIAQELNIKIN